MRQTERHTISGTLAAARTRAYTYQGLTSAAAKETHHTGTDTSGSLLRTKTYALDAFGRPTTLDNDATTPTSDDPDGRFTYSRDVHGSFSQLIDSTGAVKASYGYRPYGKADPDLTKGDLDLDNPAAGKDPLAALSPYRYTSKRHDPASKSLDMGARRFGPDPGRFLQQDLYKGALSNLRLGVDPLTQNRYALAGGNPVSFVELDGHCVFDDQGSITNHNCSVGDFNNLSVDDWIRWVDQYMVQFAEFGTERWFNNISGILHFAREEGIITPGSWFSWVDATILHAIQDGMQIFRGNIVASSTEGAAEWGTFFGATARGGADGYGLRALWATAEQKATNWGLHLAEINGAPRATAAEWVTGVFFGDMYRTGVRDPDSFAPELVRRLLPPYLGNVAADWFFDPRSTDPISGRSPTYFSARTIYQGVQSTGDADRWMLENLVVTPPVIFP